MSSNCVIVNKAKNKGKGLFASKKIPAETGIISMCQDTFITCDLVSDYYEFINLQYDPQVNTKVIFAYWLASIEIIGKGQREDENLVKKYIQQLPNYVHGMICWEEEELEQIQNKELLKIILEKKRVIQQSFRIIDKQVRRIWMKDPQRGQYRLFNNVQQVDKVFLVAVYKFYAFIQSRGVYYQTSRCGEGCNVALVPLLDKVNHSQNPNCYVKMSYISELRSLEDIDENEQILVNYGKFELDIFMLNFGFLPGGQLDPDDHEYRKKLSRFYNSLMIDR